MRIEPSVGDSREECRCLCIDDRTDEVVFSRGCTRLREEEMLRYDCEFYLGPHARVYIECGPARWESS